MSDEPSAKKVKLESEATPSTSQSETATTQPPVSGSGESSSPPKASGSGLNDSTSDKQPAIEGDLQKKERQAKKEEERKKMQ